MNLYHRSTRTRIVVNTPFIIYLLHLLGNRLTVLPPQLGQLDFLSSRKILKLDNNPWVPPIEDQLILGETITMLNSCLSALGTLKEFYNRILIEEFQ